MPGIKELKTRIKSISGTRKVTRAMQMVSAAKMRKSQDATLRSRSYASLAWELITNLTGNKLLPASSLEKEEEAAVDPLFFKEGVGGVKSLLQTFPKASKIAVLILSTNRGMVGSLNTNLLNLVSSVIARSAADEAILSPDKKIASDALAMTGKVTTTDFITYGRKGRDVMVRSHKEVLADFEKFDRTISTEDIFPISELITKLYSSGKYQKVLIFYNHFVSTLIQKPTVKQLLPFGSTTPSAFGGHPSLAGGEAPQLSSGGRGASPPAKGEYHPKGGEGVGEAPDYLFEPNPKEVLEHLLPRIIESQIYQTILESEASEQSARMVMMKNATEAAGDLISDLTLTYNKLRQNKITTELAEITAGKIALE
jgi:F-type H+-transporting ATPase subunit gamma